MIFFLMIALNAHTQDNYKEVLSKKLKELKSKVNDDTLRVKGVIKAYSGYRIYSFNEAKPFEYRLSANIQMSYRGVQIPINYNFSNGRSLYRISGPNITIPKLNNLGISPKYKWAKLHLGTRTMSFNKFTYDNMRFTGAGAEINPGNFHLKYFRGNIFQSSLNDLQYSNNLALPYKRGAWGLMSGYKSKTAEYSLIIFKAMDRYNPVSDSVTLQKVKPKANTSVGLVLKQNLFEKLNFTFETAVSAITYDLTSERVNILTHTTVFNMLGLYQKKTSSVYAYANKITTSYNFSESSQIGFNFERITKNYRTLGSLIFDNNYESYTVNVTQTIFKKLNLNSEIGIRKDGIDAESVLVGNRVVGNIAANYSPTERINLSLNYSNFRNVEKNYYQTINSLQFDSLSLALVNQNFNISGSYLLGENKKSMISVMYAIQKSNRIQEDSLITSNASNNQILTTSYSLNHNKHTIQASLTLLKTKSNNLKTSGIIPKLPNK